MRTFPRTVVAAGARLMCAALLGGGAVPCARAAVPLRLAVLELRDSSDARPAAAAYLTDLVRGRASHDFAPDELHVLTRESLELALPAGRTLLECASGSCEVEIGRRVGADYVLSGELLRFGGELRLLLKLHHCASATFLGSEPAAGRDLKALEQALPAVVSRVLQRLRTHAGLVQAEPSPLAADTLRVPAPRTAPLRAEAASPAREARAVALAADTNVFVLDELLWTTHDSGRDLDWYEAWRWCERCRAGGWPDWRLPEIEELATLGVPAREFRLGTRLLWSVSMPRAGQAYLWDTLRGVRSTAAFGTRRDTRVICVRRAGE